MRIVPLTILITAMLICSPLAIADETEDIPTNASNTGNHDSLVAALVQAELVTTLEGNGPFTVFAPTDQAFTDAGIDLAALDNEEGKITLTDILLYHVYSGSVASSDVTDGMTATMENGDDVTFTVSDTVMVNDATVVTADVIASNGIIHVIDKVLMPPADLVDIPTVASNTGNHDSLVAALVQAELVTTLEGNGPFTVFAPTDQAFTDAGIDLAALDNEEGKITLTDILLYHVYSGSVASSDVTDGMTATMENGDDVTFTVSDTVMVNDATVVTADVIASNGIIHVIDKVLMPPADEPVVTEEDGDICYNMNTHTVSAGATFDECMAYVYYENYEMNGQTFTGCYNLVTHTPSMVSQEECEAYMWTPAVDIAMTASATTIHNSLVAALTQADLVSALQADGPFTVFAPTDEAFEAAGIDLAALDTEEGKITLVDILTYHVYSGSVASTDVTDELTVTMLNGDNASFTVSDGVVKIEDANITLADVPASNGFIHVIDKVLMPPEDTTDSVQDEDDSETTTEKDTSECDVIIGIDSTGMAYDQVKVYIKVGDTVCWIWDDESMGHNVAQVDSETSTMTMTNGIYSGEPQVTVDFRHTFTEDETFYYVCEPHVANNMKGEIIVGAGTVEDSSDDSNSTPGFGIGILMVALLAGLMFNKRKTEIE